MTNELPDPRAGLPAAPAPNGAPPGMTRTRRSFDIAKALAVLALLLVGLSFWFGWHQANELRRDLARRLADADQNHKQTLLMTQETRADLRAAGARIALLEQKLAESQSQQLALQAMYQDIAKVSDEANIAEIEQIVLIASQQLQLAGDVRAALAALQTVDARLQRANRPRFFVLRRAVTEDINKLRSLPYVDVVGVSVRLDGLQAAVDTLPLNASRSEQRNAVKPAGRSDDNVVERVGREIWGELKSLLRIQNMDKDALPVLPPEQEYFMRENLKLRFLSARIALLQRHQISYETDLKAAEAALERYFDGSARSTRQALAILRDLRRQRINVDPPDISATLNAVRALSDSETKTIP